MKLFLSSDHAGVELKAALIAHLSATRPALELIDLGPQEPVRVDYPAQAWRLCEAVTSAEDVSREAKGAPSALGLLICGTGIGVSIAANKHPKVRAGLAHDAYTAAMARQHNHANVLCLGARVVGLGVAISALEAFLEAEPEGGRHAQRAAQLNALGSELGSEGGER